MLRRKVLSETVVFRPWWQYHDSLAGNPFYDSPCSPYFLYFAYFILVSIFIWCWWVFGIHVIQKCSD